MNLFILYLLLADLMINLFMKFGQKSSNVLNGSIRAIFTPGAIVSEISGKIAATIFTRNRGGNVIRNRRTPINRRSVLQSVRRQGLGNLASSWRGITQAQRDSWNSAVSNYPYQNSLGETKFLSGEQLYVQFNQNLLLIGQATIVTAPAPFAFATFTLSLSGTAVPALSLVFTPTPLTALNYFNIFATPNLSPGIGSPNASKFRYLETVDPADTSPVDILTSFQNSFGDPVDEQKIFVEIRPVGSNGQGGTPLRASAIITTI